MKEVIVFVDDEESVLKALKRLLHKWSKEKDVECVFIPDPVLAFDYIKKTDHISALVSDLKMPTMNGVELIRKIKSLGRDIPALVLTSYTDSSLVLDLINLGIHGIYTKPWEDSILISKIEALLTEQILKKEKKLFEKRMKEELYWAGELQKTLLKIKLPKNKIGAFSTIYKPLEAFQCGGDYFDIFSLSQDLFLVLIGDVAGHGVKAAFVTAMMKAIIFQDYLKARLGTRIDVGEFVGWLNNRMVDQFKEMPDMLVTFSASLMDIKNRTIEYALAGHFPPYCTDPGVRFPFVGAPGLGFQKDLKFQSQNAKYTPGSGILWYTDGASENLAHEMALVQLLDGFQFEKSKNSLLGLYKELKQNQTGGKFQDDLALILYQEK